MVKKAASASAPQNTKYLDRFIEALTLLCGGNQPPREMAHEWETGVGEDLQDWAASHTKLPWAQGIGTIEAAQLMADTPEEGMGHELRDDAYPSPYPDAPDTFATDLTERITEVFGDDWTLRLLPGGHGDIMVPGGMSYFNCSQDLDEMLAEAPADDNGSVQSAAAPG